MVDVDSLSDAQLRSKLIEFGFPVMPITGTTRKVMAKKLKLLLENKSKPINKDNRRSLGRFSSEDESDSEPKTVKKGEKSRRATMGAALMQPPNTNKVTARKTARNDSFSNSSIINDESPQREIKTITTSTTRTRKILEAARDAFDTGSESDEVADDYGPSRTRRESPHKYSSYDNYKYSSPKPMEASFGSTISRMSSSPGRLPATFAAGSSAADAAAERLQQIRSRLSLGSSISPSSNYERPILSSPSIASKSYYQDDEDVDNKENTPFLSNFTKRLSQLREIPKAAGDYEYKSEIKENDVNGSGITAKNYLSSYRTRSGRFNYGYKGVQQHGNILKDNYISVMVLVVAFLFFITLTVVYLGIRSDTALEATAYIPICGENERNKQYVNCILKDDKQKVFELQKILWPEIEKRAIDNKCFNSDYKSRMTEQEIIKYVNDNYNIEDLTQVYNDLKSLEVLIFFNPDWGVNLIQMNRENDDFKQEQIITNLEEVRQQQSKLLALVLPNPSIPWKCYLYKTVSTFLSLMMSVGGGVLLLYCLTYLYKYWKHYIQKEKEDEVQVIENIIEILQSHASESEDNFLVINHVRDMILPINHRKKKEKVWARAVKFINENESRIRTEIQVVRGEPSEVWRWLGGPNLNISGSGKSKVWQGQAFETQVGSVNSLPCSPTPCLKIRGMVEEGDRNTQMIKKAVLSKCANECRILHCAVDTKMSCVYLKCADTSDAAIAYRNLHGWWYAGNLVTVKYIRLERYMQRFPDSPSSGPYLKAPLDWAS